MAEPYIDGEKFYRLPKRGVVSGVCAGLADSYEISPTLIRVVLVVLFFSGVFPLAIAYIALIFILPKKSHYQPPSGRIKLEDVSKGPRREPTSFVSEQKVRWQLERNARRLNKLESYLVSDRYQLDHQYKKLESEPYAK